MPASENKPGKRAALEWVEGRHLVDGAFKTGLSCSIDDQCTIVLYNADCPNSPENNWKNGVYAYDIIRPNNLRTIGCACPPNLDMEQAKQFAVRKTSSIMRKNAICIERAIANITADWGKRPAGPYPIDDMFSVTIVKYPDTHIWRTKYVWRIKYLYNDKIIKKGNVDPVEENMPDTTASARELTVKAVKAFLYELAAGCDKSYRIAMAFAQQAKPDPIQSLGKSWRPATIWNTAGLILEPNPSAILFLHPMFGASQTGKWQYELMLGKRKKVVMHGFVNGYTEPNYPAEVAAKHALEWLRKTADFIRTCSDDFNAVIDTAAPAQ